MSLRSYQPYGSVPNEELLEDIANRRLQDMKAYDDLAFNAGYQTGFRKQTTILTENAVIGITDLNVLGTAASGDITFTLLDSPFDGQEHRIKNDDGSSDNVIIDPGTPLIDGSGTRTLTPGQGALIVYFLDEWRVMASI